MCGFMAEAMLNCFSVFEIFFLFVTPGLHIRKKKNNHSFAYYCGYCKMKYF